MRITFRLLILASMVVFNPSAAQDGSRGLDGYPDAIAAQISQQSRDEAAAVKDLDTKAQQYLINKYRWPHDSIISVAFNGGTPALHKAIEQVAREWTKYAHIELDFGLNPATGQYRKWSPADTERAAHIRIGFSEPGYWSAVGKDSMIDNPFGPGKPSMNFGGFIQGWPKTMPAGWRTVVLHEFGHAIGFRHEHQQDECFSEIRWQRGPGNEPDVYEVFLKWQGWKKNVVDLNLRPIDSKQLDVKSKLDLRSVMYYAMPAQAYINGAKSRCFLAKENQNISAADAQGAMLAYPRSATEMLTVAGFDEGQMTNLFERVERGLSAPQREALVLRIAAQRESARPLLYIHIQRAGDREIANRIHKESIAGGFNSQGVENMERKPARTGDTPQVRYFRDVDEGYARRESEIVERVLGKPATLVKLARLAARAKPNMVEVWLP